MNNKCIKCGIVPVAHEGEVCEACKREQDPFKQAYTSNTQNIKDRADETKQDNITAKRAARLKKNVCSTGIVRNIQTDYSESTFMQRFLVSVFTATPLPLKGGVTRFQVFYDETGTKTNEMGYISDQIVLYGDVQAGMINENNKVTVYGTRDRKNNIIASKIVNNYNGTTIHGKMIIPVLGVYLIVLNLLFFVASYIIIDEFETVVYALIFFFLLTHLDLLFKIIGFVFKIVFMSIR